MSTDLLAEGEITLLGRIMPASNHTFLCRIGDGDDALQGVYKPVSGERPLWDFADGSLAAREYAAYLVSEQFGWRVVPPTLLRDGPAGPGMVQVWKEPDPEVEAVDLVPVDAVPPGFLRVLDAYDGQDQPVALVHEDSAPLRRMAVFDAVTNNTDRKGGHILAMTDGHRYGVDHGICFHTDDKLRTVLWGFGGEQLDDLERAGVESVRDGLYDGLGEALGPLLTGPEIEAVEARCDRLLRRGLPVRRGSWPAIPWPPF